MQLLMSSLRSRLITCLYGHRACVRACVRGPISHSCANNFLTPSVGKMGIQKRTFFIHKPDASFHHGRLRGVKRRWLLKSGQRRHGWTRAPLRLQYDRTQRRWTVALAANDLPLPFWLRHLWLLHVTLLWYSNLLSTYTIVVDLVN